MVGFSASMPTWQVRLSARLPELAAELGCDLEVVDGALVATVAEASDNWVAVAWPIVAELAALWPALLFEVIAPLVVEVGPVAMVSPPELMLAVANGWGLAEWEQRARQTTREVPGVWHRARLRPRP